MCFQRGSIRWHGAQAHSTVHKGDCREALRSHEQHSTVWRWQWGIDDHLKASHRPLCGDCLKDVYQGTLES